MKKPREPGKVPEPKRAKRRSSAVSRVFAWLFVLFIIGAAVAGAGSFYLYQEYTLPGPLAENKVFIIDKGLSTQEVASTLEDNGIITHAGVFSVMAYFTGTRTRLKAGEYEFEAEATMRDVMAKIASGKSITYKISIPEGWTSTMAVARVNANEVLSGPPVEPPPEGAIMPDTYVFHRGMTRQKLVDDMQAAQKALIDSLWEKRSPLLNLDSKDEAVTLASIVEKETGVAEERPMIASVFLNRLKKGMRLQSDPTIIYGIVGGKGKLDRKLTRNDIEATTPYNTYRIDGLPPGPIANPGRAALEAVLNPEETDYLYFVADGSGGHAFSVTLDEHNRNVKKWREIAGNAAAAVATDEGRQAAADGMAPDGDSPAVRPDSQQLPAMDAEPPPPVVPPPEVLNAPAEAPAPQPEAPAAQAEAPAVQAETPAAQTEAPAPEAPQQETVDATPPPADPAAVASTDAPAPSGPPPRPGSVITVNGRLIAIPKPNPRR